MSHPIDYTVRQNVALITIDNPPVNAIGAGVPQAIMAAIARAAADPQIAADRGDGRGQDVHRGR